MCKIKAHLFCVQKSTTTKKGTKRKRKIKKKIPTPVCFVRLLSDEPQHIFLEFSKSSLHTREAETRNSKDFCFLAELKSPTDKISAVILINEFDLD